MHPSRKSVIPALLGLMLLPSGPASAEEAHHQPQAAPPAVSAPMPADPSPTPGMPMMMPMMGMMGQQRSGMPMMEMMGPGGGMGMMGQGGTMGMMGPGGPAQPGMPMGPGGMSGPEMAMPEMGAHLEGRIAFLRVELGITEAQAPQWEAFAQAWRDNVAKLRQLQMSAPRTAQLATFLEHAEQQEQWLAARLEGLAAIKSAYAQLHARLSDEQKQAAETLLTRPICLGPMGLM